MFLFFVRRRLVTPYLNVTKLFFNLIKTCTTYTTETDMTNDHTYSSKR